MGGQARLGACVKGCFLCPRVNQLQECSLDELLIACFIRRLLAVGRGYSPALHERKWCLLSGQLVQGVEVVNSSLWSPKGLQRASPCLSCHCPDGHDDRRMDRGLGQPDSENRKLYLSKIIQGGGGNRGSNECKPTYGPCGEVAFSVVGLLRAGNSREFVKSRGSSLDALEWAVGIFQVCL